MVKEKKIKPIKDYFGWYYHQRSVENKILLHLYTLLFTIVPIFFAVGHNSSLSKALPTKGGVIILAFCFLYPYGVAIRNFPTERFAAIKLALSQIFFFLFLFFTSGSTSVYQTLHIDGVVIFASMAFVTIWKFFLTGPEMKKDTWRTSLIALVLSFFVFKSIQGVWELFVTTRTGFVLYVSLISFGISLVLNTLLHLKFFQTLKPVHHFISKGKLDTQKIGMNIVEQLRGGDIILLYGEMGVGKTTLTKDIAQGLGVTDDITHPTSPLMNIYGITHKTIKNLVHIDTSLLKNTHELLDIGVENYLGAPDTITIIEWPEKLEALIAGRKVKKIFLENITEEKRRITLENF